MTTSLAGVARGRRLSVRLEKRVAPSKTISVLAPILAIVASLLAGAGLTELAGGDAIQALDSLLLGPFRSDQGLPDILVKATPILLISLGIAIAFKAQFWNIGAEGQFMIGSVVAAGTAYLFPGLPAVILLPLMAATGFLGGALFGLVPAVLKARWGSNEVVVTLMMNYIAMYVLDYLASGPWREPGNSFPWSAKLVPAAILPNLPGTRLHLGLLIGVAAIFAVAVFLNKTVAGYETRFMGANPTAARWSGISLGRRIMLVMFLSGGLAGLAGMSEVSGVYYRLKTGLSMGYGFTGVTVALLGGLSPWGVTLASVLFSDLTIGGQYMQRSLNVPFSLVGTISAMTVLFLLAGSLLARYRIRFTRG